MKKKKYLPLYYQWLEAGRLPGNGLCNSIPFGFKAVNRFSPDPEGSIHGYCTLQEAYWGYNGGGPYPSSSNLANDFTPLRQTILLFMAAINNEL
jgi:hypothetical protein